MIESSRGYGRELLRGVAAYAREQASWRLFFEERSLVDCVPPKLKQWQPDGVIARVSCAAFGRQLHQLRIPVVNLMGEKWGRWFPEVLPDQKEVVRLAVEHLLERGLRNLGFCGFSGIRFSRERQQYFVDYVSAWGLRPHFCCVPSSVRTSYDAVRAEAGQHNRELAKWLAGLPKPAGVLAANDERAHQVLTICSEIGLKVPEQVAVIGIDNDELLCELAEPTLSSVDPGCERIGYRAANLLDEIIHGHAAPPATTVVSPIGVVARHSTDVLAVTDPEVTNIAAYIRQHASDGLKVEDILRHFSISRSTLDRWFDQYVGHSASVEIARVRVRQAEELVTTTNLPLSQIAARLGFDHLETLHHLFKKWTGQTMGERRRSAHLIPPIRLTNKS